MENQDAGCMTYSASIFFNEFSAWQTSRAVFLTKNKNLIYVREKHGLVLQIFI